MPSTNATAHAIALRSVNKLYTVFPEANRRTEEAQQHKRFQAFDIFGAAAKEWLMPWKLTRIRSFVDIVSFCSVSIIFSSKAINHGSSPMCVCVRLEVFHTGTVHA